MKNYSNNSRQKKANSSFSKDIKRNNRQRFVLSDFEGYTVTGRAVLTAFGRTTGGKIETTMLLKDIVLSNKDAQGRQIDHIWVKEREIIDVSKESLSRGMTITFEAEPYRYYGEVRGKCIAEKWGLKNIRVQAA